MDKDLELEDEVLGTDPEPEPEPKGEPEKPLSVREQINKAWKEHSQEEERRDAPVDRRDRKPKSEPKPSSAAPAEPKSTPVGKGTEAPPTSAGNPPNGWSTEAKAEWVKLPPAVQAAITKRETDMSAGAKQLQDRYGGIHRVVSTQLSTPAQKYGLTTDKVLENAVSWFNVIEQNPAEGIKALAKLYKVDATFAAQPAAPAASNADPRIDNLVRTVTEMQTSRNQDAQQAELKAWAANKPHFEAVRQVMAQIVAGGAHMQDASILTDDGQRVDLDKVYERALWMNPEVRDQILKEQAEEKRKARQAELDRARKAGASVRSGTPGSGSLKDGNKAPKKGASVRETIQAAMDELRS